MRDFLARRTGVGRRAARAGRGDRGAGRRRARRGRRLRRRRWSAGSPSAAPTSTSGPRRSPPSWACGRPRPADDRALRRPGGPAGPGLAAALPLRRLPARRADQRPRPGRAGPAGALRHRAARRRPCWSATTASSWPARSPGSSSSTWPSSRSAATAAATRPTWRSARSPAGTPARTTRSTPTRRAALEARAPHAARPGWRRASRTPAARPPTTTRSAASSAAEATEKQAAKARQTERLIERLDVVEEPRKEWELRMEIAAAPRAGRGRGHPARRGRAARRLHARPGRPADRLGRPGRHHRRQRLGQVDAARRAARPVPLDAGSASLGPGRGGRRGRPGPRRCSSATEPLLDAFRRRRARPVAGRRAHAAGQVRAARGARAAPGRDALAGRAHPGRAGAAAGAAGSTCSCSTSRPTTSTCRRSSSSSRRWTATPARCCWSRTTGGCSTRCAPARRFHVVGGRVGGAQPWSRHMLAATDPGHRQARPGN